MKSQKSHHNCNACMHQRSETIEKGNNSAQSNSILSKKKQLAMREVNKLSEQISVFLHA